MKQKLVKREIYQRRLESLLALQASYEFILKTSVEALLPQAKREYQVSMKIWQAAVETRLQQVALRDESLREARERAGREREWLGSYRRLKRFLRVSRLGCLLAANECSLGRWRIQFLNRRRSLLSTMP